MDKVSPFAWGWDSLVAIATFVLGAATVWLAWTTRQLARASRDDERAQWRPVLVPGRDAAQVQYNPSTGEMRFEVRNVGRGPAFSPSAQLRSGRPLGASQPGWPGSTVALSPGDSYSMLCRISDPEGFSPGGTVIDAEIGYHDITGRWHRSLFRIIPAEPWDAENAKLGSPVLVVRQAFVYETDRELLPVFGSPMAIARQARDQRKIRNRIKRKIGGKSATR